MIEDSDVCIVQGDAVERLREMPAASVQCIVTSPPFYALRDYGMEGQIGLEDTPEQFIERLVEVFRECRRVLRDDGVLWVEIGDTYAASSTYRAPQSMHRDNGWAQEEARVPRPTIPGVKPKDLIGIPWMLAFALRADGWYLRSDTIWSRPNGMPESVTDRPSKSHSYVFMLVKQRSYFYDDEAIRTPHKHDGRKMTTITSIGAGISTHENYEGRQGAERWPGTGANAKSVWTIPTESTGFAHFASMPQALAERCIKAGTSEHGCCAECGAPWARVMERGESDYAKLKGDRSVAEIAEAQAHRGATRDHSRGSVHTVNEHGVTPSLRAREVMSTSWEPTCSHRLDQVPVPCTVLDPFMGSGTTALVARRLGRHAVGVELNPSYIEICKLRLQQLSLLG